jgi:hypothetical protein
MAASTDYRESTQFAWRDFTEALERVLTKHAGRAFSTEEERAWLLKTLTCLRSPKVAEAIQNSLRSEVIPVTPPIKTTDLLEQELLAVSAKLKRVRARRIFSWLFSRKTVTPTEGAKASGVVLSSIRDFLKEDAPWWLKGLLTVATELIDVFTSSRE